jgi:hypothetical protein
MRWLLNSTTGYINIYSFIDFAMIQQNMKKGLNFVLICFVSHITVFSQINTDSLVRYSDLKYHSSFEQEAISKFVLHNLDTFNLFLAIDENINTEEASHYHDSYNKIFIILKQKKIDAKKINKKIKTTYTSVHAEFLKKYIDNEYFPALFQNGNYNCVTASMLYALVYDRISVPYKVMASSNHVYLVANPGPKSIVIETTNPGFEKVIFTGEFKQQYVQNLLESKLISEEEYRNKSTEELFEANFKEVRETEFKSLLGFQYFNRAVLMAQDNKIEKAYELCQKAYFFYPDNQVKTLLYTTLLFQIEKCRFSEVTDIDYLAHLSRFENTEMNFIQIVFSNIVAHYLQFTDKEEYCNSLYNRLISQIENEELANEITFSYNLQMAYQYQFNEKAEYYAYNALKIKSNHRDANHILVNCIHKKVNKIDDPRILLDTINQLDLRYDNEILNPVIHDYRLISYLRLARNCYREGQSKSGDNYLSIFEESCELPISNEFLSSQVDASYSTAAAYYFNRNYRTKAKSVVQRGLKFAPDSRILNTIRY